eukprot:TRINITY_DN81828_c0_g1_i1.p1 TRINITY_DN81828_c0_g1~~TRINITY_DN81828_c0_g1_i1.p1  ORF type:complete len:243 (+),score=69.84 TRINITY_DN81828_c0_g1_i1:38-766(+)
MDFKVKRTDLTGNSWEQAMERLDAHKGADYSECTSTMTKMLKNVLENPEEEKFRKVRLSNPKFSSKVYSMRGAPEFFRLVGFKDSIEEGFIILPADADLSLLQQGVDALAAQAVARVEAEDKKKKEDEEKARAAQKEREKKKQQEAEASKFDAAVAAMNAAGGMADEEDSQLDAIESFMDANADLKAGHMFDTYEIERQVAGASGTVVVQFVASAGTSYHEYTAHMKRNEGGEWSVSKIEKA